MNYKPLSDYGIIGNTHTAALISKEASVDWLCLPRFDSASIFAAILDHQKGGYFQIRPTSSFKASHHYLGNTNVLETVFEAKEGKVQILDFMPVYLNDENRLVADSQLHRLIKVLDGHIDLRVNFAPAANYAQDETRIIKAKDKIKAKSKTLEILLVSDQEFKVENNQVTSTFSLKKGEAASFILGWHPQNNINLKDSEKKLSATIAYWRKLTQKITYDGGWKSEVIRSFLILHLLSYSPTGAIVAAATTSLPEKIGGERNWDYRFSWLRDSAFTLQALFAIGDTNEAFEYFSYLTNLYQDYGPKIDILYGIANERKLKERKLQHLEGYQKSQPVRVGNAASTQLQLDVFGELLDAAYIFLRKGGQISQKHWQMFESLVDAASKSWQKPDQGFWEVRSKPKHFVSSKLYLWVALDRGIKISKQLGYSSNKILKWQKIKKKIKSEILNSGWNKKIKSFTQDYQTQALDATVLLMPLTGFLAPDHPKMLSTFKKLSKNLVENNFLLRYRPYETNDGLPGNEGAFLAVNFWLIQYLILLNEIKEARRLFKRLLKTSSPLGIFSEMIDPKNGQMLGNLPQALTHLEVIITAHFLDQAKDK